MVRRIFPLLLAMILLAGQAFAAPAWKENTPGQAMFKAYITRVNIALAEHGESPVNSLFEMYERVAEMGITFDEDAETPEGVEITANLYYDSINSVQIRVNEVTRFPRIAAAFLLALSPESVTWEQAIDSPSRHAQKAAASSRETRTTGWRRWLPMWPGITWSKPHWSWARESCAGSKAWNWSFRTSVSPSQKALATVTTRCTSFG